MSESPFIPFYTSDFLGGTSGMTASTKGVYITLLCLMYETEAPLHQQWDALARRCGCTLPAFRKAVDALVDDGKIDVIDGRIWSDVVRKWGDWSKKHHTRPAIPLSIQREVWARDGETCAYCGSEDGPFHLDHVVPWSRGGEHSPENLTVACAECNLSKGSKTLEEWTVVQ